MIPLVLLSYLLLFVSVTVLGLAICLVFQSKQDGHRAYTYFLISIAVYVGGYGVELQFEDLKHLRLIANIEYVGLVFVPTFWLVFVFDFLGKLELKKKILKSLLIVSVTFLTLKWSDEWHHLFYRETDLFESESGVLLSIVPGVGYWLFQMFVYSCFGVSVVYLLTASFHLSVHFKKQISFILFALLVAVFPEVLNVTGNNPLAPLDLSPFGLAISSMIVLFAFFRFRTGLIIPIARDYIFENIPFGIVTLDTKFRVLDWNPQATHMIGLGEEDSGKFLSDIELFRTIQLQDSKSTHFSMKREDHWIEFDVSPIFEKDQRKECGYVLSIQDVSRQKEFIDSLKDAVRQQKTELEKTTFDLLKVSEKERLALGNDLHRSVCQDLSGLVMMGRTLLKNQLDDFKPGGVRDTLELFLEKAENASEIARNISHCLALNEVDNDVFTIELDSFARSIFQLYQVHCEVTFDCDLSPFPMNWGTTLYRIIRESVFNSLKHGNPQNIWIDFFEKKNEVFLWIVDDGGTPIGQEESVRLGLGISQMIAHAEFLNGHYTIKPNETGTGTTTCVVFPHPSKVRE